MTPKNHKQEENSDRSILIDLGSSCPPKGDNSPLTNPVLLNKDDAVSRIDGDEEIVEKVLKEIKPNVIDILKLAKQRVILTDSYYWADVRLAIKKALSFKEQETKAKVEKLKEEIGAYDEIHSDKVFDIIDKIFAEKRGGK